VPSAHDISICLIGSEQHKARPDVGDDTRFWLRVQAAGALPFVSAFKDSPDVFHEFQIEQRVGKGIRSSTLMAQIIKIEEGPDETRVLIGPDVPVPI
jgi:hypothetical protein